MGHVLAQSDSALCLPLLRKARRRGCPPVSKEPVTGSTTHMQGLMSLCLLSLSARKVPPSPQCGLLSQKCRKMTLLQVLDAGEKPACQLASLVIAATSV